METGWATDAAGRSWARQVSDVAGDLAAWLHRNHHTVPVHTAVMLMHEQAQLGRCDNLPIDLVAANPQLLMREIRRRSTPLDADDCTRIVALIRRDHQYHHDRRKRPSS